PTRFTCISSEPSVYADPADLGGIGRADGGEWGGANGPALTLARPTVARRPADATAAAPAGSPSAARPPARPPSPTPRRRSGPAARRQSPRRTATRPAGPGPRSRPRPGRSPPVDPRRPPSVSPPF